MSVPGRKRCSRVLSHVGSQGNGLYCLLAVLCCFSSAWNVFAYNESYTFTTPVGVPYSFGANDGTNNGARFYGPADLVVDSLTNLYVADGNGIRKISPQGTNWVMTTLAGTPALHGDADGTNSAAQFNLPAGIVMDNVGNLYVADTLNNSIRKVTPIGTNWVVTTIAGGGEPNPGSSDGTNTAARFDHPYGIARDNGGNLFVTDTENETIRKLTPVGTNWAATTIAGLAGSSGSADGSNSVARFSSPSALVLDPSGNIYVADLGNDTIRKVAASGTNWVVTTIAGTAGMMGSANGTNAVARFNGPGGIAIDAAGNLYVSDGVSGGTIRKLRASGTNWIVSTIAGSAGMSGNVNGTGSSARFDTPAGIALDAGGTVYVLDQYAYTLRVGQVAVILQSSISGNQVTFSWPLGASNFTLEMRSGVNSGPAWSSITSGINVTPDSYSFTTNCSLPSAFYRLHKP